MATSTTASTCSTTGTTVPAIGRSSSATPHRRIQSLGQLSPGALGESRAVRAAPRRDALAVAHVSAPEAILLAVGPGEAIAGIGGTRESEGGYEQGEGKIGTTEAARRELHCDLMSVCLVEELVVWRDASVDRCRSLNRTRIGLLDLFV